MLDVGGDERVLQIRNAARRVTFVDNRSRSAQHLMQELLKPDGFLGYLMEGNEFCLHRLVATVICFLDP
jgi:hypothetical protein